MHTYNTFRPSPLDCAGLGLSERQDWLVAPCTLSRDASILSQSNWHSQLDHLSGLEDVGAEEEDVEEHDFYHWACGWFRVLLVRPGSTAAKYAEELEHDLNKYPVVDEGDYSDRERAEAEEIWRTLYTPAERVKYIRKHKEQFEFDSFADMLGCVRGNYFRGYASDLVSR